MGFRVILSKLMPLHTIAKLAPLANYAASAAVDLKPCKKLLGNADVPLAHATRMTDPHMATHAQHFRV